MNSSRISASRAGASFRLASRFLTSLPHSGIHPSFASSLTDLVSLHSGMFRSRDRRGNAIHRLDERVPAASLGGQDFLPWRGKAVVAAPPLSCLFHPSALNPAALLQAIEQRVERGHVKAQRASRAPFNQFTDLVAVPRPSLQQRENQELGAALLQLPVENARIDI